MNLLPAINPKEFVAAVHPLLVQKDAAGLSTLLESRWTHKQIAALFTSADPDTRKIAALAFSLVGKKCCVQKLASLLHDEDRLVHQMAEHAMWSIWFRSGTPAANQALCHGSKAMGRREYEAAHEHFTRAAAIDAKFAEAFNQRAIVRYLREDFEASIEDCRRAIDLMPSHFGAWAGMGHCHAHQGRLAEAVNCYERALEIHPHLEGIRPAIAEMRQRAYGADANEQDE